MYEDLFHEIEVDLDIDDPNRILKLVGYAHVMNQHNIAKICS